MMVGSPKANAPMIVSDLFGKRGETSAIEQAPQRNRMKCRFDDQVLTLFQRGHGIQDLCERLVAMVQIATNI